VIQLGDILLFKGNTPVISSLIRWFTNSEYTHVAMAMNHQEMIEIDIHRRLAIRPIRSETFDVFRYKRGLTLQQQLDLKNYIENRIHTNQGYDWLRILSFVTQKFIRFAPIWEQANRVICSEIIDHIYTHIGIDLVPEREDGHIAPSHLASSPYLVKVQSHLACI